ncbi:MAG: methyltransferase [Anaerolineae bacterium]
MDILFDIRTSVRENYQSLEELAALEVTPASIVEMLHSTGRAWLAEVDHRPVAFAPTEAKLFDINMLVVAGGRERTEREYRTLFQAAGFNLTRIIPTHSPLSLIEGTPI